MIKKLAVVLLSASLSTSVLAEEKTQADFDVYVAALKNEATEKGYDQDLIEQAFATAKFKKKVISADKNQPEVKETLETYLPKRVPQWKIDRARITYYYTHHIIARIRMKATLSL